MSKKMSTVNCTEMNRSLVNVKKTSPCYNHPSSASLSSKNYVNRLAISYPAHNFIFSAQQKPLYVYLVD